MHSGIRIKQTAKLLHSLSVSHDCISGVTMTEENEGGGSRRRQEREEGGGLKIITGNRGLESTERERKREERERERRATKDGGRREAEEMPERRC